MEFVKHARMKVYNGWYKNLKEKADHWADWRWERTLEEMKVNKKKEPKDGYPGFPGDPKEETGTVVPPWTFYTP